MKINRANGQSLIEVVIAAAIIVIGSTVLVSAVTSAMANNRLSKERIIATRLAQEGWEWLKRQQGDDFDALFATIEDEATGPPQQYYCLGDEEVFDLKICDSCVNKKSPSVACSVYFTISDTSYTRNVMVRTEGSGDQRIITTQVIVGWWSRGKPQNVIINGSLRPPLKNF